MPERKKIKKTKDVDMQAIEGGGMIYIPKKRKRKTILPKSYNPENPGPMPDPLCKLLGPYRDPLEPVFSIFRVNFYSLSP